MFNDCSWEWHCQSCSALWDSDEACHNIFVSHVTSRKWDTLNFSGLDIIGNIFVELSGSALLWRSSDRQGAVFNTKILLSEIKKKYWPWITKECENYEITSNYPFIWSSGLVWLYFHSFISPYIDSSQILCFIRKKHTFNGHYVQKAADKPYWVNFFK